MVDVEGGQVGDVFAFVAAPGADLLVEHHSAGHTRAAVSRLFPAIGEQFVTDRRRPLLTLVEDTSPGVHDMLIAACDPARYDGLGSVGHRSCADNLRDALRAVGLRFDGPIPQPINVFMQIPVGSDGDLRWLPAPTSRGESITFEAVLDCVVVVSACPQDLVGINGSAITPLAIEVLPPSTTTTRTGAS